MRYLLLALSMGICSGATLQNLAFSAIFQGVAVDASGNIYYSAGSQYRVFRISALNGALTTVAGTGVSGDTLNSPQGLALDGSGSLYIADSFNNRVRRVELGSGTVSTVTTGALSSPEGVAIFGGVLYVADTGNHRVLKVVLATSTVTTYAGNGSSTYSGDGGQAASAGVPSPRQIAFDAAGNLYIPSGSRIRRVAVNGVISTFAGTGTAGFSGDNGAATSAQVGSPNAVVSDTLGRIYIADKFNNRVRRVSGGIITTVVGGDGTVSLPNGVAVDPHNYVYVAQSGNQTLDVITGLGNGGFSISGFTRLSNGTGVAGIKLKLSGGGLAVTDASGAYSFPELANGSYTVTPVPALYDVSISGANVSISSANVPNTNFEVSPKTPAGVFRDHAGGVQLVRNGLRFSGGGLFASNPSAAQSINGDVFIAARDVFNSLWVSSFTVKTLFWNAWNFAGGIIQGEPAIAVTKDKTAWVAVRDSFNSYWLVNYSATAGFGPWRYLAGVFSTDPSISAAPDGTLYLAGKDNSNSLWLGHYTPATSTFGDWQPGGGVVKGKPSIVAGPGGRGHIVSRDFFNNLWLAIVDGNTWKQWLFLGGLAGGLSLDPVAAASVPLESITDARSIQMLLRDSGGGIWIRYFSEGLGLSDPSTFFTHGVLMDGSLAAIDENSAIYGRDASNGVWLYNGTWAFLGYGNLIAGPLAASPR
jgi:sugar lactone lactonase YvrE